MTISSGQTYKTAPVAGNGSTTVFSFSPMIIYASDELDVITVVTTTGVETTITEGTGSTNYSVSVSSYPGTGTITYPASGGTPLASTLEIIIKRVLDLEQTTDLNMHGAWNPDVLETEFDKIVIRLTQMQEEIDRSLKIKKGQSTLVNTVELPKSVALEGIRWDSGADDIEGFSASASLPVLDTTSIVQDPSDSTKEMRIDVGAVTTGTVRVLTMPDNDVNLTMLPSTFTDGGVLLGSGTGAITAMSVLADSEMIVGDGATDPVLESGATLRTSIGVGTGDSPTFTNETLTGQLFKSVTNSIMAGTTQTQAGATALTTDINRVTVVANSGDGVALPAAVTGAEVLIVNEDASDALQVWPKSGDAIDGGSVDAVDPNELDAGESHRYFAVDGTNWYTGVSFDLQTLHIIHTAATNDDHAVEIDVDAAGFGDVKAIAIDYITGAIAATELEASVVVDIDGTGASAGVAIGLEVVATRGGLDNIYGLLAGTDVAPIIQLSGLFANADTALNKAVDVQAAWADGGAGNITTFVADNDTITIGDAAVFGEIEFEIATGASGAGVAPTFEYSTGSGTWQTFSPTDGTNGFKNTGVVVWVASQVSSPAFVVGAGSKYRIRITRTRNSLATTPIIDEVQISADTEFSWNKTGDLRINSIELGHDTDTTLTRASAGDVDIEGNIVYRAGGTDVPVTDGGTGVSTLTDGGVLLGSGTSAITAMAVLANGEFIVGDGTTDPVAESGATVRTSLGLGALATLATVGTSQIDNNAVDETKLKDALVGDFTEVTVVAGDSFLLGDASDSGNTKRDTIQGILDLAGGGGSAQATQAALEAETNEDTYAPPDLIKHSPGMAKGWVKFNMSSTISVSRNVASVTDNGTGDFTVNWATDFSGADYVVAGTALTDSSDRQRNLTLIAQAAGTSQVITCLAENDASTEDNVSDLFVVAFGDQ